MGKNTGFLEFDRKTNIGQSPLDRIKHWDEFHEPLSIEQRREQGSRCMDCGVPFCGSALKLSGMVTGCPLHNLIPEWNDDIYNGDFNDGLARLLKTSSFPEFTGRVCPALCEKACLVGSNGDSISIKNNELFLIEEGFKNGVMTPKPPSKRTDKKIAVIGSGPSGLAVANALNKRGHNVTVFERDDRFGGLLMYGIPNMKLEKHIIERRIKLMSDEGVTFVSNADFGKNLDPKQVVNDFDAVALCCGAKNPRDLSLENRDADGIFFAVDFLTQTTKSLLNSNLEDGNYTSAKDKNVIIVGGGDTGNDCVGTSIRHGAKSVIQLEMMPKAPDTRADSNPWPEWPKVCNTDYGQQESIAVFGSDPRVYQTTIKEILTENGKLTGVVTSKVEFKDGKLSLVCGSEQTLPADLILIAAGFLGSESYLSSDLNLELDARSNIKADETSYKTNADKVFACGDVRRGQSLVVWAIAEGRACAKEIEKFIMQ